MRLFVECKPDETLVTALGVSGAAVEHAAGRDGVCRRLQREEEVVGLVDQDPDAHPIPYVQSLTEIHRQHDLLVLEDRGRRNRLILVCPRLEEWLVRTVQQAGLQLTNFGFEDDRGKGLHREINQRLPNLRRLVGALMEQRQERILALQQWLNSPPSS